MCCGFVGGFLTHTCWSMRITFAQILFFMSTIPSFTLPHFIFLQIHLHLNSIRSLSTIIFNKCEFKSRIPFNTNMHGHLLPIPQRGKPFWSMWIKFLHNYSTFIITTNLHYNIHTFTISALILNTLMSTIHYDIIFMVISNNQNLYFKIQCRKPK